MKFHLLMNFLRNFRTSNLTNLRRAMWSCPFNWEGNWNLRWFRSVPRLKPGLPWWLSGEESACQCRRHGFDPQSGKIPHAKEQLSLCAKKENVCVCVCVCVCRERERETEANFTNPWTAFLPQVQKSQWHGVLGKGWYYRSATQCSSLPITMLLNSLHHWHWLWVAIINGASERETPARAWWVFVNEACFLGALPVSFFFFKG